MPSLTAAADTAALRPPRVRPRPRLRHAARALTLVLWLAALMAAAIGGVSAQCQTCWSLLCSAPVLQPAAWSCTDMVTAADFMPYASVSLNCSTTIRNRLCNFYTAQSASAQLTQCAPQYMLGFCQTACESISNCLADPTLFECAGRVDPSNVTCVTAPDVTFSSAYPPEPRSCVNVLKGRGQLTDVEYNWIELGPVGVMQRTDPLTPAIDLDFNWDLSFASLFPLDCETKSVNGGRGSAEEGLLIAWTVLVVGVLCVAGWRGRYHPLKVRDPIVVGANVLFAWMALIGFYQINMNGGTASCSLALASAFIFFPMLCWTLVMRTFSLIFQYRANEAKQQKNAHANWVWFNRVRFWFRWRGSLILIGVPFAFLCIVYATAAPNIHGESFLTSGRCKTYDFTPDALITAYALARGVNLGPTGLNPNGMAPYSVHFDSCVYCPLPDSLSWYGVVINYLSVGFLMFLLWFLRGVSDTYGIWRELVTANLMIIVITPLACMSLFNLEYQTTFLSDQTLWNYVVLAFLVVGLFVAQVAYPLALTFRSENVKQYNQSLKMLQVQLEEGSVTRGGMSVTGGSSGGPMGGSAASSPKLRTMPDGTVELALRDILADPVTLEHFRQFSIQNFDAENVEFLVDLNQYKNLPATTRYEAGLALFKRYIEVGAPLELNIDPFERQELIDYYKSGKPPAIHPNSVAGSSFADGGSVSVSVAAGARAGRDGGMTVVDLPSGSAVAVPTTPSANYKSTMELMPIPEGGGAKTKASDDDEDAPPPPAKDKEDDAAANGAAVAAASGAPKMTYNPRDSVVPPPPPPMSDAEREAEADADFEAHAKANAPSVGEALVAAATEADAKLTTNNTAAGTALAANDGAATSGGVSAMVVSAAPLNLPDISLIVRSKRLSSVYSTGSVTGTTEVAQRARAQWKANRRSEFDRVRRTIERLIDTNSWLRFKASNQYKLAVVHVLKRQAELNAASSNTSLSAGLDAESTDD